TFLDPAHQLEILQLLQKINQKYQKTIVMSIHDLNLASRFSDILIGLKQGEIIAKGTPQNVMTTENLARLFAIKAELTVDIKTEKPLLMNYELQVTEDEV
ncbi:MAG: ABC transporter ATP-binding protein, partial [Enterococcus sp.]